MANSLSESSPWLSAVKFRKILNFLGPKITVLLVSGIGIGLLTVVVELAFVYALQGLLVSLGLLSAAFAGNLPDFLPTSSLRAMLSIIFGVGVLRGLLAYAQTYDQGALIEEFKFLQRKRLLKWVFHSESASTSDVNLLFNDHIHTAGSQILNLQTLATQSTHMMVLGLLLLKISLPMTAILAVIVLPSALLIRSLTRKTRMLGEEINNEWTKTNRQLTVSIRNLLLMQLYGMQSKEEDRAQTTLSTHLKHFRSYFHVMGFQGFVPQVFGFLSICIICYGGKVWQLLPAALIISYLYLYMRFLQGGATLAQSFSNSVLYWPQMVHTAKWWADSSHDGIRGTRIIETSAPLAPSAYPVGWSIRDISFSYPGTNRQILSHFSLSIRAGTTTVITGRSGSGKSTLLSLILGLLSPTSGSIEIECENSSNIRLEKYRTALLKTVGYVGPESFLIEGTVLENLTYGAERPPSDAELREAIESAECQFLYSNPAGLNLLLTEQGHGLSAGQKQRISLARALLRKPKVLILDEATSNLDGDVEGKLIETFRSLKGKMTIVAVTHRSSMLSIADQEVHL